MNKRNRVQNPVKANFDIHDRVNYAALSSKLEINKDTNIVQMNLELDDNICSLMDYFRKIFRKLSGAPLRISCKAH